MRVSTVTALTLLLFVLGFGTEAFAQETGLLNGTNERVLLAQSKKKKKKSKKAKKEEEEAEADEGEDEEEEEEAGAAPATLQRSNRMEFDGRLIRGETAGSGAVFLFQRAPRALPSMVKTRDSYLKETVQVVLGKPGVEQFGKSKVEVRTEIEKKGKSKKKKAKSKSE